MSDTYLQDFGLLRKQMHEREVNDPMSSAGRWDDLQLDIRKPHIPKARRSPVPSNPKLRLGDVEVQLKASRVADAAKALGFQATGCYKHRLVTMQAETYRSRMRESRPDQGKLYLVKEREDKYPHADIKAAIRHLVHKIRFGKSSHLPAVGDVYRRHIRVLWPHRNLV